MSCITSACFVCRNSVLPTLWHLSWAVCIFLRFGFSFGVDSLELYLAALSIILLGANYINSLIGVVTLGKFLDDFFMQRHVSLVCLLSASVWFGIFAHSIFFT